MKLIWVFAFVFSLGALSLLAESILRQEDTQVLASKQNDPTVNDRSDSLNRLKREIASGLLIDHRTQSPLIGSVIFFLVRRTQSLAWLSFFCRTPSAVALGFHIVRPTARVLGKSRFSQTIDQISIFSLRCMITVYRN